MITVLSAFNNIYGNFQVRWPWSSLPDGLRNVHEHFSAAKPDSHGFWLIVIVAAALLVLIIGKNIYQYRHLRQNQIQDNPDQIFRELIHKLNVTPDERHLLRRLSEGARLRHPVMCLLSPGLLEWARQLWLAEKGPNVVTPDITERLGGIRNKLFDPDPA